MFRKYCEGFQNPAPVGYNWDSRDTVVQDFATIHGIIEEAIFRFECFRVTTLPVRFPCRGGSTFGLFGPNMLDTLMWDVTGNIRQTPSYEAHEKPVQ